MTTQRRMRQRVRTGLDIETAKLAKKTPKAKPLVRADIWATVMRLTGHSLKGVEVHTYTWVELPVSSLTEEAKRELGVL